MLFKDFEGRIIHVGILYLFMEEKLSVVVNSFRTRF